jgi:sorting nexin-25
MEFMDRRHRSLPVQFWLTVESFKNPLETVDSDSSGSEDDLQDLFISPTIKEDVSMIHDLYFSSSAVAPALATISKKHVDIIREFVRNHADPSQAVQRRVRRSILLAQRQIETDMEQDFEEFERSDLWFRVINDTDFSMPESRDANHISMTIPHSLPPAKPASPLPSHIISDGPSSASSSEFTIQRTTSSGSARSSNRPPTNNIGVLMSSDIGAESSRAPLFNDPEDEIQRAEEKRMEAIHAALTDMMALENEESGPSLFGDESTDIEAPFKNSSVHDKGKRGAVFDDVEPEEPDEGDEGELEISLTEESLPYRPAGPGDLQLSFEIGRLSDKITHLETQEAMLDNLIRKAELTGDTQELKLLNKSKSAMNRELRELQFQKTQYEQQENANRLISDRTKVSIVSSAISEESGKSVVRYLVEVQQLALDGSFASGWVVARRYNEFFNMHNRLREKYALVKNLDFPGKRLVTTLSGSFVDMRKAALEKYLQVTILFRLQRNNS